MEHDSHKPKPLIPFTPVPVRARHDGWTVEKQIAFIEALAETGWSTIAAHSLSGGQATTTMPASCARVGSLRSLRFAAHRCGYWKG